MRCVVCINVFCCVRRPVEDAIDGGGSMMMCEDWYQRMNHSCQNDIKKGFLAWSVMRYICVL
jgi:hypothetical protein